MRAIYTIPSYIAVVSLALLGAGCSEHEHAEDDPHAGHDHGHSHAGHSHEASDDAPSGEDCAIHNAPVSLCFICDASLRDPDRLWCGGHARYEDRCWLCNPQLEDPNREWCTEHSLYEDECFLCDPSRRGKADQARGGTAGLMCNEHGVLEAECGICRPQVVGALDPGQGIKVRLPSADSADLIGVQTSQPEQGNIGTAIECLAELSFNQNQSAQIVAPVGGIIQSVDVDLGSQVNEGDVVATLWSASIAEAVAQAILTHQTLKRERRLRDERVTAEKDLQAAEAAHRAACQQLHTLGFTEEQIDELGDKPEQSVLLQVRAPFAGEIVERSAVRGSLVDTGKALFMVADRSVMWAELSLPETQLRHVRTGQPVELNIDALPGEVFTGKLTWIGPAVDARTRMARARAEIPNPDGLLRDKMFARARIITDASRGALVVPPSAIQTVDGKPLVFVRLAEDLFEARAVRLGTRHGDVQEVIAGLTRDDDVVTRSSFAVKSQLLLSRLGAGCAHE